MKTKVDHRIYLFSRTSNQCPVEFISMTTAGVIAFALFTHMLLKLTVRDKGCAAKTVFVIKRLRPSHRNSSVSKQRLLIRRRPTDHCGDKCIYPLKSSPVLNPLWCMWWAYTGIACCRVFSNPFVIVRVVSSYGIISYSDGDIASLALTKPENTLLLFPK